MQDFTKLVVWQKSHALTLAVYKATMAFPREEMYGLTSQMRRASSSVPANIAEGCGRSSNADLARFMHIALGSASELQYHLLLAHDLEFLPETVYETLKNAVIEVKRMLVAFIQKLKTEN